MLDSRVLHKVLGQQIAESRPSLIGDAAAQGAPVDVGPTASSTP